MSERRRRVCLVVVAVGCLAVFTLAGCGKKYRPKQIPARRWTSVTVECWRKSDADAYYKGAAAKITDPLTLKIPDPVTFKITDAPSLAALRRAFVVRGSTELEGGVRATHGQVFIALDSGDTWMLYLNWPRRFCAETPSWEAHYELQVGPAFYHELRKTIEKRAGYEIEF